MTDNLSYCFIVNGASNGYQAEKFFKRKEKYLSGMFPNAEFHFIQPEESIREITAEKAKEFTHVVACGGDGTVNKVVNGIMGTNATLGVIPLGSGNDFAQSIQVDGSFEQSVQIIRKNQVKTIDLINFNDAYIVNTCGIGVDGATNYYAAKSLFKNSFIKYFLGGLTALISSDKFGVTLRISDNEIKIPDKIWMIALANGKNEGGRYTISPNSDHKDGFFEVVIAKGMSRIRLFIEFLKLSLGFSFDHKVVDIYSTNKSVYIQVDQPQKAHLDGEQLQPFTEDVFQIIPHALKVVSAG
ncbi:MAG: YegS/Rv2252/BmrU family lipid kinase [Gracilimonas sp.]|nr:YegS/Rv2252/BmrU family lipid kinase [Gracilimonas sp.]